MTRSSATFLRMKIAGGIIMDLARLRVALWEALPTPSRASCMRFLRLLRHVPLGQKTEDSTTTSAAQFLRPWVRVVPRHGAVRARLMINPLDPALFLLFNCRPVPAG
mmetsp:Transcript_53015/g.141713  ORF Transcript_53015/g.141713 Transcript_53015/m.141713 type:complete len:107 (-) Transcript_53015:162-482(-)